MVMNEVTAAIGTTSPRARERMGACTRSLGTEPGRPPDLLLFRTRRDNPGLIFNCSSLARLRSRGCSWDEEMGDRVKG